MDHVENNWEREVETYEGFNENAAFILRCIIVDFT